MEFNFNSNIPFAYNASETGKFVAPNNIMPDRFNSISEPRSFPISAIGLPIELTEDDKIISIKEEPSSENSIEQNKDIY